MATDGLLATTENSLERMQNFDTKLLARESDLGSQLNFRELTEVATAIVLLYNRIPASILEDFSDTQLTKIQREADSDFQLFNQVLKFDPTLANASATRTNLINQINQRRDPLFDQLWQFIAYRVARITDTGLLEAQARATIQAIEDRSAGFSQQLASASRDADVALAAIRAVASEQGVSQQAIYFKEEAAEQEVLAKKWLERTHAFACTLGIFAVVSLFLHKIAWLKPESTSELVQLVSSKFLIFAVIAFMLVHAVRNYASCKHNAVINRHRQNALLTYRALVQASDAGSTQDIVLANAAACIFSPQTTGFSTTGSDSTNGAKSVLELMTKGTSKASE